MNTLRKPLVLLLGSLFVLFSLGCAKGRTTPKPVIDNNTVFKAGGGITLVSDGTCTSAFRAEIQRILPAADTAIDSNTDVVWEVRGYGCNQYRLRRPNDGVSDITFTSAYRFAKRYPLGSARYQEVTIQALSSSGTTIIERSVRSDSFNVGQGAEILNSDGQYNSNAPLSCMVVTDDSDVYVALDAETGRVMREVHPVNLMVLVNRPAILSAKADFSGSLRLNQSIPGIAASTIHELTAVPESSGYNETVFTVVDPRDPTKAASCGINIFRGWFYVYPPPNLYVSIHIQQTTVVTPVRVEPDPVCQLTPSHTSRLPGQSLRLTLTCQGYATAPQIDGHAVSTPYGGELTVQVSHTRQYTAQVTSYYERIITITSASVAVNDVWIGVNFEDLVWWTRDGQRGERQGSASGGDFNDSVVCLNGKFALESGYTIRSIIDQTVNILISKRSACNNMIRFTVRASDGSVRYSSGEFTSSSRAGGNNSNGSFGNVSFRAGDYLKVDFYGGGSQCVNTWVNHENTDWVRTRISTDINSACRRTGG